MFLLFLPSFWKLAQLEECARTPKSDLSSPSHLLVDTSYHQLGTSGRRDTREKERAVNTRQNCTEGYGKLISSEDIVSVTSST